MSVKKRGERLLNLDQQTAISKASDALFAIGANIGSKSNDRLIAEMPGGLRSFGENIEVVVTAQGTQSHLVITSTSSMGTTLVDWGKNQSNINDFFSELDVIVQTAQVSSFQGASGEPAIDSGLAVPEPASQQAKPSGKTFISYRRADSKYVAGRIYDSLRHEFGDANIYKDVDSIPLGTDFRHHIREYISQCDSFVAIIGLNWAVDQNNVNRLVEPEDWVRIEIEIAMELSSQIAIIPVFVDSAEFPEESLIPSSLHDLRYRNGMMIRPDPDFHNDMKRLIGGLKQ